MLIGVEGDGIESPLTLSFTGDLEPIGPTDIAFEYACADINLGQHETTIDIQHVLSANEEHLHPVNTKSSMKPAHGGDIVLEISILTSFTTLVCK